MARLLLQAFIMFFVVFPGVAHAGTLTGKVTVQGSSNSSDVVVYLEGIRGDFSPPPAPPEMNHVNLRFQPQVLAVMRGATVPFPNSDPVFHSAFSVSTSNPFDLGIYSRGRKKSFRFENPGIVEIFCRIHAHMQAFVLVLENPYFTMTDKEGNYRIQNVPVGIYTVHVWKSRGVKANQKVRLPQVGATILDFILKP